VVAITHCSILCLPSHPKPDGGVKLSITKDSVGLWMSSTYIASVLKFALYSNLGKAVKEVIKEFNNHPPVDITVLQHSIVELNK